MGALTQEAVIVHSKIVELGAFRLLCVLAIGANDADGLIDPAPSYETLAQILKCTKKTVGNRLDALVAAGELERVRVGGGPGHPSAYRVLLPREQCGSLLGRNNSRSEPRLDRLASLEAKVERLLEVVGGDGGNVGAGMVETWAGMVETREGDGGNVGAGMVETRGGDGGNVGAGMVETWAGMVETRGGDGGNVGAGMVETREANGGNALSGKGGQKHIETIETKRETTPRSDTKWMEFFRLNEIPTPTNRYEWDLVKSPSAVAWMMATGTWPGWDALPIITRRLGQTARVDVLREAWELWRGSGHRPQNVVGVLEWYKNLCRDREWCPGRHNGNGVVKAPAGGGGAVLGAPIMVEGWSL